jgi:tetratricopeptide (TPR) repeat protein
MKDKLGRVVLLLTALGVYVWGLFIRPAIPLHVEKLDRERQLARKTDQLMATHRYAEALSPLEQLHRKLPRNLVYIEQLARVYRKLDRPVQEAAMLERFIELSPKPADACPRIGLVYKKLDKTEEAIGAFERCATFDPDDPDIMFQLGLLYERHGRRPAAAELYRRGAQLDPKNPDLAIGMARTHLHQGDSRSALAHVLPALARRPKDADGLLVAGLALRNLRRFDEAKVYLERGLAQRNSVEMRVALGLLAQIQKKEADARNHYAEALKLNPNDRDVRRRFEQVGGKL